VKSSSILSALIIGYVALAFGFFSPDGLYSGDIGVKYVQARSLADNHFTSLDIPYRSEFIDPSARFLPLRPPFIMTMGSGVQAIFSPGTAIVNGLFVAIAGYPGMILASLVSAAVVLWLSWKLAAGPAAIGAPIVLGLATPWWFYGVTGWEHGPAVAFAVAGFFAAARASGWRAALAAGVLVGLGSTLRDEVVLLAPALAFAVWYSTRRWLPIAAAALGVVVVLVGAGAVEVFWFHRPLAAHLQHAVHLFRSAVHATSTPNPDVPALVPMTLKERYDTVVVYWLTGVSGWIPALAVLSIAIAAGVRRWVGSSWLMVIALGAAVFFAALDAWELLRAPKWIAGMYRLSPFLVFAVLPAPAGGPASNWIRSVAFVALVTYLVLAFAGTDTSGGKSLGPRLLLPLLPLLAVSAWQGISLHLRSPAPGDHTVGRLGLVLVALSLVIHLTGTIPAYGERSRDDGSVVKYLRASNEQLIVLDDPFTAQLMLLLYYEKSLLLADTQVLANDLAGKLIASRFHSVLVVSRDPYNTIVLPGFEKTDRQAVGRMFVREWRRR
jgi:hypothetical protein